MCGCSIALPHAQAHKTGKKLQMNDKRYCLGWYDIDGDFVGLVMQLVS